ncbi:MAG: T9SS type A sorting domain-containing protein [Bacteroidetes bacterium]|nr:T9SS type A sorting domain-containing protein [Bacteroidota bacterium]
MKKLFAIAIVIIAFLNVQASDWVNISSDEPAPANISLISSQITESSVHFTLSGFWKEVISTDQGDAWLISLENGVPSIQQGAPDLPIFAGSIVVPDMSNMKVQVLSSQYVEYNNVLIAPSKGNLTRDIDPATVPYSFGKPYETNAFYPGELAKINEPYIIRDLRGQALHFQPFQYNPVTKVLRVYTDMTIEIVEDGLSSVNIIERQDLPSKMDAEFMEIYKNHFMNFNSSERYDPVGEHGNMLVISYGDFMDEMEPFIEWKTMTGIHIEMIDVAEIGNATAIKQYIVDYYNDNGLTFVLLVGDAQQVPTSYSSGDSDVNYSYVVGNDHYPDLFVGRFSAENSDHVITQVQRVIDYEKYPIEDDTDWYTKCMSIGSSQGPGDDGEYDYEHLRNISDNKLFPFTYDYVYEYFDGSQGGNDGSGNPSASSVGVGIDEGATIINYTGHGSTTSWSSSGFSNSNVNQLSNVGKLPFVISVACVNGNFVNTTCFAEAWLRAEDNDEPAGAIATLMSTINQSWNPPMRGQDVMADILTEADEDNIKRTFGGITMNGCMGMNDAYGSGGYEMTDTWLIFGDPSLVVRTAVPMDLTVTHPTALLLGMSSITVDCDVEDAMVALSMDGVLLGSAMIEDGSATIDFEPFTSVGTADLVVTAFNHKPYIAAIEVVPAEGPFIVYVDHMVNDATGNDNGMIDCGESILLDFTIENVGVEEAEVEVEIGTDNPYVTMIDSTESFGNVLAEGEMTVEDAFSFTMANNVPDQTVITFSFMATVPDREDFESTFTDIANAPALAIEFMNVDDSEGGNDNGRLDAGETVNMVYHAWNNGHTISADAIMNLTSSSSYITVNTASVELGPLEVAGYMEASFEIVAAEDAPVGVLANFSTDLVADAYSAAETTLLPIGLIVEDFETGDFTSFDWTFSGNADWEIINIGAYEGIYSAKSGDINDNQNSVLELVVDVPMDDVVSFYKKVSSESGYDELRFYIDGSEKGSWDGNVAWSFEEYAITEGEHTLKWEYDKDGSQSSGSDCAWLDYIILPSAGLAPLFADFTSDIQNVYEIPDVNFTSNSVGDITGYEWTFEGGEPETSTEERPMVSYYVPGVYDVTLTVTDGENENTIVKEDYITVHYWVGMQDDILNEAVIKAYPNPFSNSLSIELNLVQSVDVTIEIFDLTGRVLQTMSDGELTSGRHIFKWDATSIEPGLYFYSVRSGNEAFTRKLVLSR